nr:deoxycytidine triphosphate deaminase [uncultured bacterium]AIA11928.1 deoxycytidine triphosphate deaminase [uncultured bacterium]
MVLTQADIIEYVKGGKLSFSPGLDTFQLQAHSVDLRLGFTFLVPKSWHVTKNGREQLHMDYYASEKPDYFDVVELEKGQFFDLLPGEHILVSSLESVKLPDDLMAVMYPRSSTNRKGISVDQTGIVDSGYEGQLVIPIRNNTQSQTVRLYPGERFCQIVFQKLNQEVRARKSRYHRKDIIEGVDVDSLDQERQVEIQLIASGDIRNLKANYGVLPTESKKK